MFSFPPSRLIPALIAATVLVSSGCSTGMGAAIDAARQLVARPARADAQPLDPNFAYLRVTRDRHVGLLWRGNLERTDDGVVEVYYGSGGEIVRLRDGRVVGALGLNTEWRGVAIKPPDWATAAKSDAPLSVVRLRDVMPGYRSGVKDDLLLRTTPAPQRSELQVRTPESLIWFEEAPLSPGSLAGLRSSPEALPPARYAVDLSGAQPVVVYSEQCLARDFCFTWQRWSAAMQKASATP